MIKEQKERIAALSKSRKEAVEDYKVGERRQEQFLDTFISSGTVGRERSKSSEGKERVGSTDGS